MFEPCVYHFSFLVHSSHFFSTNLCLSSERLPCRGFLVCHFFEVCFFFFFCPQFKCFIWSNGSVQNTLRMPVFISTIFHVVSYFSWVERVLNYVFKIFFISLYIYPCLFPSLPFFPFCSCYSFVFSFEVPFIFCLALTFTFCLTLTFRHGLPVISIHICPKFYFTICLEVGLPGYKILDLPSF